MHILGISCFYHDSAAALLNDGLLVAAAQEERFSRVKHDNGFPRLAIQFCLEQAGITSEELEYVVFYEKPLVKFERILLTSLGTFPRSWRSLSEALIAWFNEKLWIKSLLMQELGLPAERILFTEHHLAHAASAFFCSPFEDAAVLTVDGVGEWTTSSWGRATASWTDGECNTIEMDQELRFPHSLGLLYSAFTAFLGFEVNEGEYKVMGMAPYGTPRYVDKIYGHLVNVCADGSFWLNMDYFSYHHSPDQSFSRRFSELFGQPRQPGSPFVTPLSHPGRANPSDPTVEQSQYYADVAASIQRVTEEILLGMVSMLHRRTGLSCLCIAGGVALNTSANGRIMAETPFQDIFIQPAPGDDGGALGAALYVYHVLLHQPRKMVLEHAYWGQSYGESAVRSALQEAGARWECIEDDERLTDRITDALLAGKVVALQQGRFEWGPRALGNRSILADPRRADMKDIVNGKIKFREPFRPFAPVILEERASDFFAGLSDARRHYPARYMLYVLPWCGDAGSHIPAVNHVGTGRLQTIRREWNPRYYRLVEKFGEATGVPVLLNTSFNLRGEPIVNSPADALSTFRRSGIDILVTGQYWVEK